MRQSLIKYSPWTLETSPSCRCKFILRSHKVVLHWQSYHSEKMFISAQQHICDAKFFSDVCGKRSETTICQEKRKDIYDYYSIPLFSQACMLSLSLSLSFIFSIISSNLSHTFSRSLLYAFVLALTYTHRKMQRTTNFLPLAVRS